MTRSDAISTIAERAATDIPEPSRARFVEIVETELLNLHIGNIARYRLRPSEFYAWTEIWEGQ